MVINLGGFSFDWTMANAIGIETEFSISSNERLSNYPEYFRSTLGKESLSLSCKTLPYAKHGNHALDPLYTLASLGEPLPLVTGTGEYWGNYVVVSIGEGRSVFTNEGYFLAQEFSLELEKSYD